MTPVFLLVYSLTFDWGVTSAESAFKNSSHLTENDERAEEAEALRQLEVDLEELLQSHLAVQIQQEDHQQHESEQQYQQQVHEQHGHQQHDQQEYEKQEHQQQQEHGIRLRR